MTLAVGTRLGAFEITGRIGAGGMGEVYRATDTKLGRAVAIKTLPAALADDADRLARFEREAKLLAALSHAHIASVYSLDEHEGMLYIAMELVEGETLEDRLKSGPLPVEDGLQLGLQIALALEAAHEKGVVHRDLKPANVMITPDGIVKVLDFGLAKAFMGDPDEASPAHSPALSLAMTQQGLVLGTAAYMSPEQASGQASDQRADIWSFGVVLYEMLTGQPLFSGETVPHILAAVLQTEPDWDRLPASLNPRIRLLLERCLRKKVRRRYHSIADVRVDIEEALQDPEGLAGLPGVQAAATALWTPGRVALVAALVLFAAGATASGVWLAMQPEPSIRVVDRFRIQIPAGQSLVTAPAGPSIALSRDGRRLAYLAQDGVYLREMDTIEPRRVEGTEANIGGFVFSPDAESILYLLPNDIRRISVNGGSSVAVGDSELGDIGGHSGVWEADDTLLVGHRGGISAIAIFGNRIDSVIELEPDQIAGWPQRLPDGESLLFSLSDNPTDWEDAEVVVATLETGDIRVLFVGGSNARYLPTGHIVYTQRNVLYGVPFDLDTLDVTGVPEPLVSGISSAVVGWANFAISDEGTLVYVSGAGTAGQIDLTPYLLSRDGDGDETLPIAEPRIHRRPSLSPDGSRLAVTIQDAGQQTSDLWIYDLVRGGVPIRITRDGEGTAVALWEPVGDSILYWARSGGLYRRRIDATGEAGLIWSGPDSFSIINPEALTPDGSELIFVGIERDASAQGFNIYRVALTEGSEPVLLLGEEYNEGTVALSPNGQWLAYASNETGRDEVYVRPYPDVDSRRIRISMSGGREPQWSPDGAELFYRSGLDLIGVPIDVSSDFSAGNPQTIEQNVFTELNTAIPTYDVHPNGRQFLLLRFGAMQEGAGASPEILVVRNWIEELRERVPVD